MATSKYCEIKSPDTDGHNITTDTTCESTDTTCESTDTTCESTDITFESTDTTCQSTAADTGKIDRTCDKLTPPSEDNTSESLALAKLDRDNQGPWEFEYSYGGEADLHRYYDKCEKNPGHKNFIPVDKFSIDDLPEDYRHQDVFDYIRAVSDLTVRVAVKYVGGSRQATAPGYRVGDRRRVVVGTGWVYSIKCYEKRACKCKDCRNSSTPEMNFATIIINTAAHVVFDDLEGEHTKCNLFFDRGGTPESCSGAVTLTGMSGVYSDVIEDICYMDHYTHNLDLARRLLQTLEKMRELKLKVCNIIPRMSQLKQSRKTQDKQPLMFLASHPHGCSKHISLGCWTSADVFNNIIMSFMYNMPTCPGSSGALVSVLPEFASPGFKLLFAVSDSQLIPMPKAHCGAFSDKPGSNFFRLSGVVHTHGFVSVEMLQLNKGGVEDMCCVEEEDQNQHYAACKKNPGHENFFPVEKFSMDNLPSFYRSDDAMEFIKLMSDLTVRVSVKYVSEERPETVPGTDITSPWFSNKGSKLTRIGNGWITGGSVDISENCDCKECRNSPIPKPLAYIVIQTVAHLIYDKQEAEYTTCHLFFDSGETPDVCRNVVALTDVHEFSKEFHFNTCTIRYFTHNQDLVTRLNHMTRQYMDELYSLSKREDAKSTNQVKENEKDQANQETSLYIVVSHPHGCAKQISICCCDDPGGVEEMICCVEEEDQNQHYAACKKNPGHENFFSVEKFSIDNLPLFYRRDDVMEFIKLTSDLTVRVSVKYVSDNRREAVPETDIPPHWFSNKGSNLTRVGNGWIKDGWVDINENCNCMECRNSPKPKPLAYIEIQTTEHLIFDKLEAEHSTCHLFFDSGETPDVCRNVVTLTDVHEFYHQNQFNTCTIRYFTHNQDLVTRLTLMIRRYMDAVYSLSKRDDAKSTNQVKQNEKDQSKQELPLYIVVSHPHGCAKQISICCCDDPGNADIEESQCSHSSILCPGSSGAPVIDMSRKVFYPLLV